jgi:hypothetical protein
MKNALIGFALLCTPLAAMIGWATLFPDDPYNPDIFGFARATYETCASPPELHRTVRCDALVKFWQMCDAAPDGCTIDKTRKLLTRLDFDPPALRLSPPR